MELMGARIRQKMSENCFSYCAKGGSVIEIVIPIGIALLVTIILTIVFQGSDKVDKGFKINYFKLSYRRKMIRSLTILPILILATIVIYYYTEWSMTTNILVGLAILILFLVQLIYNFYMWKKNEE